MTGIAGIYNWKKERHEQLETLKSMTSVLSHRRVGSERTVQFVEGDLAVTAGALWTADGVTVAVEGYLYNGNEIAKELVASGHLLTDDGLAALFQAGYLRWGESFVERFYGAFAFVLWDSRQQKLVLGRDQIGIKPLYYADCAGGIPFGSEIKTILAHPLVKREIDTSGLTEMLVKGPFFTPGQALFREVREVQPGQLVIFTPQGKKIVRYWDLKRQRHEDSFEETLVKLNDILEKNVVTLKRAGLIETAILSGGLDSSGLIALLSRQIGSDYKTYCGNTPESYEGDQEERDSVWAQRVADHLNITNEEALVDYSAIMETIDRPRRIQDLPTFAQYESTVLNVFRTIRDRGHSTILVGEAADEMIGSLEWFYKADVLGRATFPWHTDANRMFVAEDVLRKIHAEEYLQDIYRDYMRQVPRSAEDTPEQARLKEAFYLSVRDYLPTILRRNDRLAMSLSMEASIPFADPRFAQYVFNIPWEMINYGDRRKGVLREAFRSVLPDEVVYRKKAIAPVVFSEKYAEYLQSEFEAILRDPHAPLYELINREKIREVLDSGQLIKDRNLRWRVDYYLQINHWLNDYQVTIL